MTDSNLGNTTYGYDEVGNLKSVVYPNAIKHQYTYNALNRLDLLIDRSPTNTIINCWKYHTTGADQRTWVEEFDHRTAWYTYDNLGRLKTETVTGSIQDGKNGTVTYGYDSVGNRQTRSSSLSGVTNQAFGYDANDRLNGDQYDSNGNTKSAPVSQPSTLNSQQVLGTDDYDSENRLKQRTGTNGSTVRLVYDGDGNRICEIVAGQIKSYLIDDRNLTGYAQVVEEIVNGSVNHTYTYGLDLISQDQHNAATNSWHASFYAYDGRGTVRFLSDETGAVTDTYTYDAFGTLITATGSTNNRSLYSDEQFDPNLGLYYLRARLMNPLTGRFWTQDSFEGYHDDPKTLHKYVYANVDPISGSDPGGNMTLTEATVTTGIISHLALMSYATLNRDFETDFGSIPDAGVIGITGSSRRVMQVLGKFAGQMSGVTLPPGIGNNSSGFVSVELVFSIASAQLAVFVAPGISVGGGDYVSVSSGVIYNMYNVHSYCGPFFTGTAGPVNGFLGVEGFEGAYGASISRRLGGQSSPVSVSYSNYSLLGFENYPSMHYSLALASGWAASTSALFGGTSLPTIGVSMGIASYWPYAKWKNPEKLQYRQSHKSLGGPSL